MKPLWQYWVETIFWTVIVIIAIFLALSLIDWLIITIGGIATLSIGAFLVGTYIVACFWSVFDTNTRHMTPWFYKEDK